MPTLGYGADALTFHALHARCAELLQLLKDQTTPQECLVYYRPSFGRAGGEASPQFGEFDAILCAMTVVCLIETKWNSGDQFQPAVELKKVQVLRHRIFAWLYEHWSQVDRGTGNLEWADFLNARADAFTQAFPHRPLAPSGSLLARNLQSMLNMITPGRRRIRNLLLHFSPQGINGPEQIVYPPLPPGEGLPFELVTMPYPSIEPSRYFHLQK